MWSSESFDVKNNIGFAILIEFSSQRKKLVKSVHKQKIGLLWSRQSFGESTISDLESPSNFKVKEKNYSNRSINKKLDFCGPVSHLRESTILDLESPSNFQVKEITLFWKEPHARVFMGGCIKVLKSNKLRRDPLIFSYFSIS